MKPFNRIVIFICFFFAFTSSHINSNIYKFEHSTEDLLETQIDPRLPKSFSSTEFLSTRFNTFTNYQLWENSINGFVNKSIPRNNWEIYARWYWYETRDINMTCPQFPTGIAATCDWALMVPCLFGDVTKPPKTIFVHTMMLPHFVESTIKFYIEKFATPDFRYVLISSGHDMTTPQSNMDVRYSPLRGFGGGEGDGDGGSYFKSLIHSPHLVHWFIQNPDMIHPKLTALPIGFVDHEFSQFPSYTSTHPSPSSSPSFTPTFLPTSLSSSTLTTNTSTTSTSSSSSSSVSSSSISSSSSTTTPINVPLSTRPLLVLNADRVRTGSGQWTERSEILAKCQETSAREWCTQPYGGTQSRTEFGISRKEFLSFLGSVPFILCVHGGGVDPSPKAFEAILRGTIPIFLKSTIASGYTHLPVIMLDNWDQLFNLPTSASLGLNPEETFSLEDQLEEWRGVGEYGIGMYYEEGSYLRNQSIYRLTTSYWANLILYTWENGRVLPSSHYTSPPIINTPSTSTSATPVYSPTPSPIYSDTPQSKKSCEIVSSSLSLCSWQGRRTTSSSSSSSSYLSSSSIIERGQFSPHLRSTRSTSTSTRKILDQQKLYQQQQEEEEEGEGEGEGEEIEKSEENEVGIQIQQEEERKVRILQWIEMDKLRLERLEKERQQQE